MLAATICAHQADDIRTALEQDPPGNTAYPLEFSRFVCDLEALRQIPRNEARFMRAQDFEKILGQFRSQYLASIEALEQLHHLSRGRNVFPALAGGLKVHHLSLQPSVIQTQQIHEP